MSHPDQYSSFYTKEKLGFDIKLVEYCYKTYKPYFTGKTCLELGPATGYMTRLLVNDFKEVTAVEGSVALLNQIDVHPNLVKIASLFEDFKPVKKFDTIILNHVLEHIEHPVALLKIIKNWMADGGVFIIGVPNAKSFHRLAAVKMGLLENEFQLNERDKELGHYRVYDIAGLTDDIQQGGFYLKASGGIFLKFLSNAQIEKYLTEEVIEAYYKLGDSFANNCAEIFVVLSGTKI